MPPPSDWVGCPEEAFTPPDESLSAELSGESPPSSQGGQSHVGTGIDELLGEEGLLGDEGELLEVDDDDSEFEEEETLADSEVEEDAEVLVDEVDPLAEDELMVSRVTLC